MKITKERLVKKLQNHSNFQNLYEIIFKAIIAALYTSILNAFQIRFFLNP